MIERKPWLLLGWACLAIAAVPAFPAGGGFESGIWSGEGRPVIVAKADLAVRSGPSLQSPVLQGKVIKKGDGIEFIETRVRTTEPGTLKAVRTETLKVTSYGESEYLSHDDYYAKGVSKPIKVKAGEPCEYLLYRAEGYHLIRIGREVMEVMDLDKHFEVVTPSTIEWWVGVGLGAGKKGWVLITDDIAGITRSF
jgi:hypothetical protein